MVTLTHLEVYEHCSTIIIRTQDGRVTAGVLAGHNRQTDRDARNLGKCASLRSLRPAQLSMPPARVH
jgi:hypothetical protein